MIALLVWIALCLGFSAGYTIGSHVATSRAIRMWRESRNHKEASHG
jgi:hypothetical protein